jgi:hypothetical protein
VPLFSLPLLLLLSVCFLLCQVFALMKERDALKRAAAGSGAAADGPDVRRLEAELKQKDELVTQVRSMRCGFHPHIFKMPYLYSFTPRGRQRYWL